MSSLADHGAATIEARLSVEGSHTLWTEPARVAVKLVFAKRVTRDEVDPMAFIAEPERNLDGRNATPHHAHRLLVVRRRPAVEADIENVVDARIVAGRPVWPKRLLGRADGQHRVARLQIRLTRHLENYAVRGQRAADRSGLDVTVGQLEELHDTVAMRVE